MKGKAVVESFDAATMVLTAVTRKGETRTLTLSPEAKIGLIEHGKADGKNGFRKGSAEDIVPGLKIVMAKVREGLVTKIVFSVPKAQDCEPVEPAPEGEGDTPPDCSNEGEDTPTEEEPPTQP